MSQKQESENIFAGVHSVLGKKLRNKNKKLDRIRGLEKEQKTSKGSLSKEQMDMIAGKEKLVSDIKDLQATQNQIIAETKKLEDKVGSSSSKKQEVQKQSSELIAEACLASLIHSNYGEKILEEETASALEKALTAFHLALTPQDSLNYDRAREGFVFLVDSLLQKSSEIIPGTDKSFSAIAGDLEKIRPTLEGRVFSLEQEQAVEEQKEEQVQEQPEQAESSTPAVTHEATKEEVQETKNAQDQDWGDIQDDDEGADEEIEDEVEDQMSQKSKPNQQKGTTVKRKPQTKPNNIDEDGYEIVRDTRFRGRGKGKRGGRGAIRGYKTRGKYHGPKQHHQRDPKTSHGKRPNWQKGEKRTETNEQS